MHIYTFNIVYVIIMLIYVEYIMYGPHYTRNGFSSFMKSVHMEVLGSSGCVSDPWRTVGPELLNFAQKYYVSTP